MIPLSDIDFLFRARRVGIVGGNVKLDDGGIDLLMVDFVEPPTSIAVEAMGQKESVFVPRVELNSVASVDAVWSGQLEA